MPFRGRGRGRPGRSLAQQVSRLTAQVASLKQSTTGREIRVPKDVTPYVPRPWNEATLTHLVDDASTISYITPAVVFSALEASTGLTLPANQIEFKLYSVKAWSASASIQLVCFDLEAGSAIRFEKIDIEGKNHFPSVGYHWPARDAQNVIIANTSNTFNLVGLKSAGNAFAQLRVAWRYSVNYI